MWLVSKLSLAAIVSYGVESLGQTITLGFVGHYFQEQEIGAVIVAICFLYMFLLFPGIGALFAMDTLVARYYGNDPTTDRIGEVLQRALCINVIYTAVVAIVVWTVVPSCVSFLAHPELAPLTSLWLMYCPIYILGTLTSRALTKYFINQHLTQYPPVAAAIGQVSSVLLHMWLVPKLGLVGSALAFGLCTFVQACVLAIMAYWVDQTRVAFGRWDLKRAMRYDGLKEYLILGFHSSLYIAGEVGIHDVTAIILGHVGAKPAAAWGILHSLYILVIDCACGLSAGGCAFVGSRLGAHQPKSAKVFAWATIISSFLFAVTAATLLFVFQNQVFRVFAESRAIHAVAQPVFGTFAVFLVLDVLEVVFQGIFSAMGRNDIGALIMFATLWGVGFPLMLYWCLFSVPHNPQHTTLAEDTGALFGLIHALQVALVLNVPLASWYVIHKTDWSLLTGTSMSASP